VWWNGVGGGSKATSEAGTKSQSQSQGGAAGSSSKFVNALAKSQGSLDLVQDGPPRILLDRGAAATAAAPDEGKRIMMELLKQQELRLQQARNVQRFRRPAEPATSITGTPGATRSSTLQILTPVSAKATGPTMDSSLNAQELSVSIGALDGEFIGRLQADLSEQLVMVPHSRQHLQNCGAMCLNNLLNFAVFTSGRATEIKSFLTLWQMQAVHKVADFMQTDTYRNTFNPSKLSITLLEHAGLDSFPMHYPSSGNKGIVPVPAIEFLADTITDVCSEPARPVRERDQEIFKKVVDVIKDCVPAVTSVCGVTPEQLVACVQCIGGRLSAVVGTNIAQANLYTLHGRPTPLCMNATRGFLLLLPGPVTHFLSLSKREPDGTYLLQDPRYAASVQLSAEQATAVIEAFLSKDDGGLGFTLVWALSGTTIFESCVSSGKPFDEKMQMQHVLTVFLNFKQSRPHTSGLDDVKKQYNIDPANCETVKQTVLKQLKSQGTARLALQQWWTTIVTPGRCRAALFQQVASAPFDCRAIVLDVNAGVKAITGRDVQWFEKNGVALPKFTTNQYATARRGMQNLGVDMFALSNQNAQNADSAPT
jgi:hypothetical protein